MPIEISLPNPDPQPNLRIGWPNQANALAVGGAFDITGFANDFQGPNTWGASIGVGANTMDLQDDILCALFSTAVERVFTPYAIIKPLVADLAPGYASPTQQRVYRVQWSMRMVAPALDRASGMQFAPTNVLGNAWTQAGGAAFGIVGDGAGAWEYIQSDTAAFPGNVTASFVIPASVVPDAEDWNSFDMELINSAPGRPASMSLFVNNQEVLTKNWTTFAAPDTGPLPALGEVVDGNKFVWGCRAATAATGFFMGPLVVDMGRFTRGGLELLS